MSENDVERRNCVDALASSNAEQEGFADKALREVQLIGAGLAGFQDCAEEAFTPDHWRETVGKLAFSAGTGFVLAKYAPTKTLLGSFVRAGSTAAALGFAGDVLNNGTKVWGALADNAQSGENWERNVQTMRESVGKFGYDTALMTVGAFAGGGLGNRVFNRELYGLRRGREVGDVLKFMRKESLATMSYIGADGMPMSSCVEPVVLPRSGEVVIATMNHYRKPEALKQNPRVSMVFGGRDNITVQYEGTAREILNGAELAQARKLVSKKYPASGEFAEDPGARFFRIEPSKIFHTDYRAKIANRSEFLPTSGSLRLVSRGAFPKS